MNSKQVNELHTRVTGHLNQVYPDIKVDELAVKLIETMGLSKSYSEPARHKNHWDEKDVAVITYADTFKRGE
ncbi:MAG: alpha-amylase, partial [Gammaproteobacteria bacterium]